MSKEHEREGGESMECEQKVRLQERKSASRTVWSDRAEEPRSKFLRALAQIWVKFIS